MKNGLKNRNYYGYTVIKNIFAYYTGKAYESNMDVYLAHLQLLRLLLDGGRITEKEYLLYKYHLNRASSGMCARYVNSLYK